MPIQKGALRETRSVGNVRLEVNVGGQDIASARNAQVGRFEGWCKEKEGEVSFAVGSHIGNERVLA